MGRYGYVADFYRDGVLVREKWHFPNMNMLKINASAPRKRVEDTESAEPVANSLQVWEAKPMMAGVPAGGSPRECQFSTGREHGVYERRGGRWLKLPDDSMGSPEERLERLHARQRGRVQRDYGVERERAGRSRRLLEETLADFADYYRRETGEEIPVEYLRGFASETVPDPEAPPEPVGSTSATSTA